MKTTQENLSVQESLSIITDMIAQAKGNASQHRFFFLLWGWVAIVAYLGIFTLTRLGVENPYWVWLISIPAGIATFLMASSKRHQIGTVTHLGKSLGWLWASFGITFFIMTLFLQSIEYDIISIIIALTATPTFISGYVIRFKPLQIGGISFWGFAILAFLVDAEYKNLIGALAYLVGYLIPGYLLKTQKERENV